MASVKKQIRDGRTTWLARWRTPEGTQRKRSFARKIDAEAHLTTVEHALSVGSYVDASAGRITVGEWSDRWLQSQAHLKKSTLFRYASIVRTHIVPRWGPVRLSSVGHADVLAWVAQLSASGQSGSSVRQIRLVFSLMLSLAVRDGRISRNPVDGVKPPRARKAEKRFLSHVEVDRLADEAGPGRLVVYVLAYCGLRFGELAALRCRDVQVARRRIEVARSVTAVNGEMVWSDTKGHQRRSVPIPPFLAEDLAVSVEGRGPDDPLFPAPRVGVLRESNFRRDCFDPAARRAGLAGLTPHELRHTAASLAVSAGANAKAVQRMLGHASAAMTMDVYSGLFEEDLDEVGERMSEHRARAVVPPVRPEGASLVVPVEALTG